MRTRLLVVLLGLLVPLAVPGQASAAPPVVHEHFRDTFELPNEDEGPILCPVGENTFVEFSESSSFHGQDLIKPVPDGVGQAFFGHTNYAFTAEHVNLDTGVGFTVKINGVFKERTAELVPEADWPAPALDENGEEIPIVGPVYRFTAVEVAHVMVRDDDGRLVYNERGRILWEAVFDTLGDEEPGGVLLFEEEPVVLAGTDPFFDFCELALELTT
jgi:hypothetical protein